MYGEEVYRLHSYLLTTYVYGSRYNPKIFTEKDVKIYNPYRSSKLDCIWHVTTTCDTKWVLKIVFCTEKKFGLTSALEILIV